MYLVGQKVICVVQSPVDSKKHFNNAVCKVNHILYPPRYNPDYHDFYKANILYSLEWIQEENGGAPVPTNFKYYLWNERQLRIFPPKQIFARTKNELPDV